MVGCYIKIFVACKYKQSTRNRLQKKKKNELKQEKKKMLYTQRDTKITFTFQWRNNWDDVVVYLKRKCLLDCRRRLRRSSVVVVVVAWLNASCKVHLHCRRQSFVDIEPRSSLFLSVWSINTPVWPSIGLSQGARQNNGRSIYIHIRIHTVNINRLPTPRKKIRS